ncbi:MAG TPA: M43 family zinc metalloprotease [Kofleriaceae bacterium]|nr:M43 family zinc metalloprotease [Kofleriaceae bacterium]
MLLPLLCGLVPSTWFTADVVRTEAHWTSDGSRIVTTATLRTGDGRELQVTQLGGTADGYTQVVWDDQVALEPGLRVRIAAHPGAGAATWVADEVIDLQTGTSTPSVRTRTKKSGVPLYWAKSCVEVVRPAEGTTGIAGDLEQDVMRDVFDHWNTSVASCSFLNVVDQGAQTHEVGRDFVNVIKFRDQQWCRPPVDGDDERCFNGQAAGVTTVTFVDEPSDERDGEIVDADIELNNVTFRLTVNGQGSGAATCAADLANTLTHEVGHLLGLEHTCRGPGDPERVDHTGAAVPLCSDTIDPVVTEATMYPFQMCGETKKASLEPDDTQAICISHPAADDPGVCEAPDDLSGGCCGAAPDPRAPVGLALLVLALASGRRRRSAPRR